MVPDHESNKLAKFWEDEHAQKRQHVDDVNKQTDSAVNIQSTPQTEQAIESNEVIQSDMEGQESDNSEAASITSKDKKAKHRQDKRREKKIKRKKKD